MNNEPEVLIRAEGVSKKFCRSLRRSLWYGIRDMTGAITPWRTKSSESNEQLRKDEFWAVRDISFEVRRGECLGLIGHNGAGKSTLLKMLNSLNAPDEGRIEMRGRIGALIELGAGFNPILSGRENIFNQAALLGFSRSETERKFDAIVDFSELESFLDMPLANYSSGMKVKLGFAVSSQMEPDVLLIDEVLAVGDLGFRYKCLNKIADLMNRCAVVFVSHSMPQVMRVATDIMVLSGGNSIFYGSDVASGLESYFDLFDEGGPRLTGSGEVSIRSIEARTESEVCYLNETLSAMHGDDLEFEIELEPARHLSRIVVQLLFWNHEMLPVLDVIEEGHHGYEIDVSDQSVNVSVRVPSIPLNAGRYQVSVIVTHPNLERVYCQLDHAIGVTIGTGSPASGAGCLSLGAWKTTTPTLSLKTRALLAQSDLGNRKLSHEDTCIFEELSPGDIAVDCGANVGLVTSLMASRDAVVHAFEPDPAAFEVLLEKFARNPNVHLHNKAVSNEYGTMRLYHRRERDEDPVKYSVGSTLLSTKTDVNATSYVDVEVVRLVDFLDQFERVRLLKVDIEGAECDVLEDLLESSTLEHVDLALVETHETWIPETAPRIRAIKQRLSDSGMSHVHMNWI